MNLAVAPFPTSKILTFCRLFHRVNQRRQSLDPNFQTVPRRDRPYSAGSAGQDDISGHERQVRGNETNQLKTIKNQLAGIGVLAQLAILKELDRQVVRIEFGFNVWAQRRKRVEGLRAGPLALGILNRPITDI